MMEREIVLGQSPYRSMQPGDQAVSLSRTDSCGGPSFGRLEVADRGSFLVVFLDYQAAVELREALDALIQEAEPPLAGAPDQE